METRKIYLAQRKNDNGEALSLNLIFYRYFFDKLYLISYGTYEVKNMVKEENIGMATECIKHAIDLRLGWKKGYYIEFNQDYTKFKKKKI